MGSMKGTRGEGPGAACSESGCCPSRCLPTTPQRAPLMPLLMGTPEGASWGNGQVPV